ncbi:hypothetical protein [Cryobacterium sp. Y50]|uniref:hypothetical protein n=1 Tax=Cryobacterium sp. Y50 TaxID=2048286 RepID=UPI000CE4FFBE|nr:hypothetical protein [Cryobacterium sp. Y50]
MAQTATVPCVNVNVNVNVDVGVSKTEEHVDAHPRTSENFDDVCQNERWVALSAAHASAGVSPLGDMSAHFVKVFWPL